jgi:hypothetical protein
VTAEAMRLEITKVYPSADFKKKLRAMTDNQVVAIYRRLQREGKIK